MRNKENRLVITFHSTTEAMEAEKRLKELGVPGLAWSAPERERENVIQSVGLMQLSFEKMAVVQI